MIVTQKIFSFFPIESEFLRLISNLTNVYLTINIFGCSLKKADVSIFFVTHYGVELFCVIITTSLNVLIELCALIHLECFTYHLQQQQQVVREPL